MKKLRVVQIGIKHDHASEIMKSMRRQPDVFEVVGYAVPDQAEPPCYGDKLPECYEGVAQYSPEEILNLDNLDAVVIETAEKMLTKYAKMAIDKGLPVHMDKPGGISHEEYAEMLHAAQAKGLVFHTGYMYRYNLAVQKLLKMIDNGELGEIYSVETHMDCLHIPEKRQWLDRFKGGMMFYLGCHLIDLIYRIMGEPEEIIPLNLPTGLDGVTSEDYGMAVLKYKNGVSFAKTCAAEAGGFFRRQLVVCGSKGTVEIKPFEMNAENNLLYTDMRIVYTQDALKEGWGAQGTTERFYANRYDNMMKGFAAMVRGEMQNPYSYEYEEKLHALVLKACGYRKISCKTGCDTQSDKF